MPGSALTPQAAVERLGSTSSEVRTAVIFDERGDLAVHTAEEAGSPERLRDLAEELFAVADGAGPRAGADPVVRFEVSRPQGGVFGVRASGAGGAGPTALVAVTAPGALSSLVLYDMRMTLRDMEPDTGEGT